MQRAFEENTKRELRVRLMREADLPEVAAIEEENFSRPWTKEAFADSLALGHTLFLAAELDGKIAGYCGCYQSLEEAEITNVCVAEEFRGRGIGRALLKELMRIGRERGAFAYTLEVRVGNTGAIRLYRSLGFESLGVRRDFYDMPREDALIMWRRWQA